MRRQRSQQRDRGPPLCDKLHHFPVGFATLGAVLPNFFKQRHVGTQIQYRFATTWTEDNLLRQVVYEGLREEKPSTEVRRPAPHPQLPQ